MHGSGKKAWCQAAQRWQSAGGIPGTFPLPPNTLKKLKGREHNKYKNYLKRLFYSEHKDAYELKKINRVCTFSGRSCTQNRVLREVTTYYYTCSVTWIGMKTRSPTPADMPVSQCNPNKGRLRSAIPEFAKNFLTYTYGLFKKQTFSSNLTGNAASRLKRPHGYCRSGWGIASLLSESHKTHKYTEWSHCSRCIYSKCVWRLTQQMRKCSTTEQFWRVCSLCSLLLKTG